MWTVTGTSPSRSLCTAVWRTRSWWATSRRSPSRRPRSPRTSPRTCAWCWSRTWTPALWIRSSELLENISTASEYFLLLLLRRPGYQLSSILFLPYFIYSSISFNKFIVVYPRLVFPSAPIFPGPWRLARGCVRYRDNYPSYRRTAEHIWRCVHLTD